MKLLARIIVTPNNVAEFRIYHQEAERGGGQVFRASNGVRLSSLSGPALSGESIFLQGSDEDFDNGYYLEDELPMSQYYDAIVEYNNS